MYTNHSRLHIIHNRIHKISLVITQYVKQSLYIIEWTPWSQIHRELKILSATFLLTVLLFRTVIDKTESIILFVFNCRGSSRALKEERRRRSRSWSSRWTARIPSKMALWMLQTLWATLEQALKKAYCVKRTLLYCRSQITASCLSL